VLVYLWPALIGGKVLTPTAGLFYNPPWQHLPAPGLAGYVNRQLEDVTMLYYPWHVLARQLIHAGTFPAWDPHALGGVPLLANPQVAWLSPFTVVTWLLPLNYALGLAAAFKLFLAGFGTYLLARSLRLDFWPAMLAATSFALCAFDVVWLEHGVQVSVAVFLPWTLWLVERIAQRGRPADGLALCAIAVAVLTGGHPGTELHVLSAGVLYAGVRLALADLTHRERARRIGLVALAFGLAVLTTAVTLLPAQLASQGTAGVYAREHGAVEFAGSHLSIGVLRTLLFPDWWGRFRFAAGPGPANYSERTFYGGSVALVLAGLALVTPTRWRSKAPFALLGLLGLAVPLHAPGIYDFVERLPLFHVVQNQRMVLWLFVAIAVLAAFGLQTAIEAPRRGQVRALLAVAVTAGVVAAATLEIEGATWHRALHAFLDRSPFGAPDATSPALASIGWWIVFVLALGALLVVLGRVRPARRTLVVSLVVALAALDMLHFAHGFQPMAPASHAIPPVTPAIAYLQHHAGDSRIAASEFALLPDFSSVFGLRDARGNEPPQPSLSFFRLWAAVEPQATPGGYYLTTPVTRENARVLELLGTKYILTRPEVRPGIRSLSTAYRGSEATIFTDRAAMPRAIAATYVQPEGDEALQIRTVTEADFDPRLTAVVPSGELGTFERPSSGTSPGAVHVLRESDSAVTLHADLSTSTIVVLDDAWYPGWDVTVDGRPARALRADVVLRGVVVPAGSHTIAWRYHVPGLRLGAALSVIGLLGIAAWGGLLVTRRRRKRRARERPARMASR
jgi:hypothetical protein